MPRFHPFFVGLVGAAAVLFFLGAFWTASSISVLVPLPLVGALLGALICRWRPGFEAPWPRLLPVAVLTNPVTLMALIELSLKWRCIAGLGGEGCLLMPLVLTTLAICVALPLAGLAWRWWRRRPAA